MRKTLHKVHISSINDPDTVYRGWAIGNEILAISDYGKEQLMNETLNLITTEEILTPPPKYLTIRVNHTIMCC